MRCLAIYSLPPQSACGPLLRASTSSREAGARVKLALPPQSACGPLLRASTSSREAGARVKLAIG